MIIDFWQWFYALPMTSDGEFWRVITLLSLLSFLAFRAWFNTASLARLIENTPQTKINSSPQGMVELHGRCHAEETVISPQSKKICVWFDLEIQSPSRFGFGRWQTMSQVRSHSLFLLKDETGECWIDPENAQFESGLSRLHKKDWRIDRHSGHRYRESVLLENDEIYVLGNLNTQRSSPPSFSQRLRHLVIRWKNDPKILRRFDLNKDGKIDAHEWQVLRRVASRETSKQDLSAYHQQASVVHKGQGRAFIISPFPQSELIKNLTIKAAITFLSFLGLITVCGWLVITRLAYG